MAKSKENVEGTLLSVESTDYYEISLGVTLSQNYNSIRVDAKYGRHRRTGESDDDFFSSIEEVAQDRLTEMSDELSVVLGSPKSTSKPKRRSLG